MSPIDIQSSDFAPSRLTEAEQEHHRLQSRRSLAHTAAMTKNALSTTCREHDAIMGQYCWGPTTRGLCMARYLRGLRLNYVSGQPQWVPLKSIKIQVISSPTGSRSR